MHRVHGLALASNQPFLDALAKHLHKEYIRRGAAGENESPSSKTNRAATAAHGGNSEAAEANANASTGKYAHLKDSKSMGPGKKYTSSQKNKILAENKRMNSGVLKDDVTGEVLNAPQQSKKGKKADMKQAEVDHVKPRSKGGSNSFGNASVRSKRNNIDKSDKE